VFLLYVMRFLCLTVIFILGTIHNVTSQDSKIQEQLQNFFFSIPFKQDIQVIKKDLESNSNISLFTDPNRTDKSITGRVIQDTHLNTKAVGNRFIITEKSTQKKSSLISIKWSIDFRQEDLAIALNEYEDLKNKFKPLFADFVETIKGGSHQEEIHTLTLKKEKMSVIIRIIKYNSTRHTISLEYTDTWKKLTKSS
jgi:hypothetical protein